MPEINLNKEPKIARIGLNNETELDFSSLRSLYIFDGRGEISLPNISDTINGLIYYTEFLTRKDQALTKILANRFLEKRKIELNEYREIHSEEAKKGKITFHYNLSLNKNHYLIFNILRERINKEYPFNLGITNSELVNEILSMTIHNNQIMKDFIMNTYIGNLYHIPATISLKFLLHTDAPDSTEKEHLKDLAKDYSLAEKLKNTINKKNIPYLKFRNIHKNFTEYNSNISDFNYIGAFNGYFLIFYFFVEKSRTSTFSIADLIERFFYEPDEKGILTFANYNYMPLFKEFLEKIEKLVIAHS